MHELFTQVLSSKDLSKAGDLFSVPDEAIASGLTEVINAICEIASSPDYVNNDNDQSVVEICITRVTSAIRETDSIEQHAEAMVSLLESCLNHNLKPSAKGEDPPHAKISSDIISCIFLHYSKKNVMKRVLPVAVKFLHKGNKEISRNMASYLSLAAVHNARLLSRHIQLIIDSVISGNYPLCRVLPQIYEETKDQIHDHAMALVSLLPSCDLTEKLALLHLFALISNNMPTLLEASLPQLCEYLGTSSTASATMQVFLNMAEKYPQMLIDSIPKIKKAVDYHPNTLCLAAQVLAAIGKLSKDKAQDALNFVLEYLPKVDRGSQGMLLREATQLCSSYPVLCTDKMLAEVWQCSRNKSNETMNKVNMTNMDRNSPINQTMNGITIVKVNGENESSNSNCKMNSNLGSRPLSVVHPSSVIHNGGFEEPWLNRQEVNRVVITPRLRLIGDSRSTGRLHTSAAHRTSNSKIGSIGGLHKSMTKLSSNQLNCQPSQQIQLLNCHANSQNNSSQLINTRPIMTSGYAHQYSINSPSNKIYCGGVTVTTRDSSPTKSIFGSASALRDDGIVTSSSIARHSIPTYCSVQSSHDSSNYHLIQSDVNHLMNSSSHHQTSARLLSTPSSSPLNQSLILNQSSVGNLQSISGSLEATESIPSPTIVVPRKPKGTTVTIVNNNHKPSVSSLSQRISVFEPYPMRDTIQHFCEKHLDKIKTYMENVSLHIPPPAKCTIEERRAKKMVKLHFACQGRGEHCLYNRTFFTMKTRYPRIWIHLMFLTLQARSSSALSSRHAAVTSLKNCWDILKCENRTFLTLVTSAFPCIKDQEVLLNELRRSGFCDVFECSGSRMNLWCCFLCNHPERAIGFLQDSQPVIEGQLKEKKGRWKLFKRWKTRYFTLSGAHLSYKESKDDKEVTPIEVHQIRSVKVCRGARNIPKAFEIFTGDQSLILKPKRGKNAEEWVQCLSIVVAHSQAKEIPSRSSSLIRNTT
ncbi:protein melted isoform X2 [Planococcus citri]|uniref:protein melted isoform X2 n=1 Tax=Planococcus citri TaxID=170843 RepID=UPI0031F9839C